MAVKTNAKKVATKKGAKAAEKVVKRTVRKVKKAAEENKKK